MRIERDQIFHALSHVTKHGDTDIFPFPLELKFYSQKIDDVATKLASEDYSNFSPLSLVESLIPKTKFGFRVAHQPYPSDTVIFTAMVCSIFDQVEQARTPVAEGRSFSYRKNIGTAEPFFLEGNSFKDWMDKISISHFETGFTHVIRTDISDFYMRIYRHRLENILESTSGNGDVVKRIERTLANWRGGQSFGVPIGSDAARLLAEAALHDTDMALISEGYEHTRYVDDMIIYIREGQSPYAALAFLAKHLTENEGLSLNNQKTTIFGWEEFLQAMFNPDGSDEEVKENWATEKLFWAAYGKDEMDPEALAALMTKDLVKELEEQLNEKFWDFGLIRIILHAMRLVGGPEVAAYIRDNLEELIPFAKDVSLLIESYMRGGHAGFNGVSEELTELLLSPAMAPLDCARAWFLELGVRGHVSFSSADMRRLEALTGTLDSRQLHLIRWRQNDVNYFRSRKARVNEITVWSQPTFIFGASCLPKDEYNHWIRSIRSRLQFPLGLEFANWCLATQGTDPYVAQQAAQ